MKGFKDESLHKTMNTMQNVKKSLRKVVDPEVTRKEKLTRLKQQNVIRRSIIRNGNKDDNYGRNSSSSSSDGYLCMSADGLQDARKFLKKVTVSDNNNNTIQKTKPHRSSKTETKKSLLSSSSSSSSMPPISPSTSWTTEVPSSFMGDYYRKFICTTTKTKAFQLLVSKAFDICDMSDDGIIDESELYTGLILVHLNLAKYAGPSACYPPTRQVCDLMFEKADKDQSNGIDRIEFQYIIGILCGQIISRMIVYWIVVILCVPVVASYVILITNIPQNTYLELATRETISLISFCIAIPVLWNYIDARSSSSGSDGRSSSNNTNATHTTNRPPQKEQRERRRERKSLLQRRRSNNNNNDDNNTFEMVL